MAERWDSVWKNDIFEGHKDLSKSHHWKWLAKYLPPPARVLEAGCGLGYWVESLDSLGYEAYGIDFSSETVARAHKRWPQLRLTTGDFRSMKFPDCYFDGIVSFGAVEHDERGPQSALHEMLRVLKPNGVLYCTVPCLNHLRAFGLLTLEQWIVRNRVIRRITGRHPETEFFEYIYKPKEYSEILQSVGFRLVEIVGLPPYGTWRKFFLCRLLVDYLHNINPFITCHMMAAICRKSTAIR